MGLIWATTSTLHLPDGEWLEHRNELTEADREFMHAESWHLRAVEGSDGAYEGQFNAYSYRRALAQRMVTKWSFVFPATQMVEGEDIPHPKAGQPVPVEAEYVGLLDRDTMDALRDAVDAKNPVRTPAEAAKS